MSNNYLHFSLNVSGFSESVINTTLYCIYAFNGVEEGKARMGERGRDEEVASSKKKPIED